MERVEVVERAAYDALQLEVIDAIARKVEAESALARALGRQPI